MSKNLRKDQLHLLWGTGEPHDAMKPGEPSESVQPGEWRQPSQQRKPGNLFGRLQF